MPKAKTFIINDESFYNSYRFRVLTAGISLDRFKTNPVMLDSHVNNSESVLGKWDNIRVEDSKLLADADFDEADEKAKAISGKVERGYIKGTSMGLLINYGADDFILEANGKLALSKCELIECSIIPVPSNAGALRLYVQKDGELQLVDESELKLSLQNITSKFQSKENNMKKVFLSVAALVALGLDKAHSSEGVDVSDIENAVNKLKQDSDTLQLKLTATEATLKKYTDAETAKADAEIKLFVDSVIPSKYDESERETITKLAKADLSFAKKTAALVPDKKNLGATVKNTEVSKAGEVKTIEDFQKLSLAAQLSFKAEHPEEYKKMVEAA